MTVETVSGVLVSIPVFKHQLSSEQLSSSKNIQCIWNCQLMDVGNEAECLVFAILLLRDAHPLNRT